MASPVWGNGCAPKKARKSSRVLPGPVNTNPSHPQEFIMEKIGRRSFCGMAAMAVPLICLNAKLGGNSPGQADAVIDSLADEISQVTKDGVQKGFRGEHMRRYAGVVRTFDAYLEQKGNNKDFDNKLDDDDYSQINPAYTARITTEYWKKRAIDFDEDELAAQLAAITPADYRAMKQAIKKRGGIRVLHKGTSDLFERKAKEYDAHANKEGADLEKVPIQFPFRSKSSRSNFIQVQDFPDPSQLMLMSIGNSADCLCKALLVEGSILAMLCATVVCPECCPISAVMLAIKDLLEAFGACNSNRC